MEHSSASSEAFEPIPEPDIEETPRGDDLKLTGKSVEKGSVSRSKNVPKESGGARSKDKPMECPVSSKDTWIKSSSVHKSRDNSGSPKIQRHQNSTAGYDFNYPNEMQHLSRSNETYVISKSEDKLQTLSRKQSQSPRVHRHLNQNTQPEFSPYDPNKKKQAGSVHQEMRLKRSTEDEHRTESLSRPNEREQVSMLRQEMGYENDIKDEDLYSKVTSILEESEEGPRLTERLRKLGIDFNFLKSEAKKDIDSEDIEKKLENVHVNGDSNPTLRTRKKSLLDEVEYDDTSTVTDFEESKESDKCSKCQRRLEASQICSCEKSRVSNAIPMPSKCGVSPRVKPGTSFQNRVEKSWTKEERLGISDSTDSNGIIDRSKKPQSSLPHHLKAELSLNLRASTESSSKNDTKKSMDASSISIDYSQSSDDPRKSLGVDLQNQLSLNLQDSVDSSVKSCTGAKSKKHPWNTKMNKQRDNVLFRQNGRNEPKDEPRDELNEDEPNQMSINLQDSVDSSVKSYTGAKSKKYQWNTKSTKTQNTSGSNQDQQNDDLIRDELNQPEPEPESPAIVDEQYSEFVNRLIADPRLKDRNSEARKWEANIRPSSQQSRRPGSAPAKGRVSKSASYSRVRESTEAEAPPRRWETSSRAWVGSSGDDCKYILSLLIDCFDLIFTDFGA